MLKAEEHLAHHQELPAATKAFLTTAKNKEGINIKNKDFHTMFVEAHNEIDVVQMVGRLRNPIHVLYIIIDSVPHSDMESRFEKDLSKNSRIVPTINTYFHALCNNNGLDLQDSEDTLRSPTYSFQELADCLDFLHEKFPYLRYDYFTDQFVYYSERETSKAYYAEQHQAYNSARRSSRSLIQLVDQWFPGIPCTVNVLLPDDVQLAVDEYLCQNRWLDGQKEIRQAERSEILAKINELARTSHRQLKTALRHYGYKLTTAHRANGTSTISKAD